MQFIINIMFSILILFFLITPLILVVYTSIQSNKKIDELKAEINKNSEMIRWIVENMPTYVSAETTGVQSIVDDDNHKIGFKSSIKK